MHAGCDTIFDFTKWVSNPPGSLKAYKVSTRIAAEIKAAMPEGRNLLKMICNEYKLRKFFEFAEVLILTHFSKIL